MKQTQEQVIWFIIGGGTASILIVHFLTPLSAAPIGSNGADWITGIIAAFWWGVGSAVGLVIYKVIRLIRHKTSNSN